MKADSQYSPTVGDWGELKFPRLQVVITIRRFFLPAGSSRGRRFEVKDRPHAMIPTPPNLQPRPTSAPGTPPRGGAEERPHFPPSAESYWISRGPLVRGPYPRSEIERMVGQGLVRLEDGCSADRQTWAPVASLLSSSAFRIDSAHAAKRLPPSLGWEEQRQLSEELIARALRKANLTDPRFYQAPAIPAHLVQSATRAYAAGAAKILALFDASESGAGDEGFVITVRGLNWRLPPESATTTLSGMASTSLGNVPALSGLAGQLARPSPIVGNLLFQSMPAGRPFVFPTGSAAAGAEQPTSGGKLQFGAANCLYLPQLHRDSLEALADFFLEAAEIAQGRSPRLRLAEGELFARQGEARAAEEAFRQALTADITLAAEVIAAATAAASETADGLARFADELRRMATDDSQHWRLRRADRAVQGPMAVGELRSLAGQGLLLADDECLHFGDTRWRLVEEMDWFPAAEVRVYQRCGQATGEQLRAAANALLAACGPEQTLLGVFAAQPAAGNGVCVLGLTGEELLAAVISQENGAVKVHRDRWTSTSWRWSPATHVPGARLLLAMSSLEVDVQFHPGRGLDVLRRLSSRIFIDKAAACVHNREYCLAERLLRQVHHVEGDKREQVQRLREKIGTRIEVIAVYDGGHPAMGDRLLGALRIDSLGVEFVSIMPGEPASLRLEFSQLREVSPPVRGAVPEELAKKLSQSERTQRLLKTGLAFGAAAMLPGGGLLVNGLMGGKKSEGAPQNRLCVTAELDGATYRMFFEVAGDTREELDRQAKAFWAAANQVRRRFGGGRRSPGESLEIARQTALLKEIRDLLERLVDDRRSLPSQSPPPDKHSQSAPGGRPFAVVACPHCSQRLRVASAGVVQCPKCQHRARVSAAHFQKQQSN